MGLPGWGTLAGKIAEQFQGREERLRNEKGRLERELKEIESKSGKAYTDAVARRESQVKKRIDEITELLVNAR